MRANECVCAYVYVRVRQVADTVLSVEHASLMLCVVHETTRAGVWVNLICRARQEVKK